MFQQVNFEGTLGKAVGCLSDSLAFGFVSAIKCSYTSQPFSARHSVFWPKSETRWCFKVSFFIHQCIYTHTVYLYVNMYMYMNAHVNMYMYRPSSAKEEPHGRQQIPMHANKDRQR